MAIKRSDKLTDFIRGKEKFVATPYKDVTGKLTVGYGDTGDTGGEMTTISEQEALRRMEDRLNIGESELNKAITRKNLSQSQQDVLLDMEYNMGITKLREQGFIDIVNNGTDEQIGRSILNFNKARDEKTGEMKEFAGLTKRAQERAQMWGYTGQTPVVEDAAKEGPSDPFDDFSDFRPTDNSASDFKDFQNFKPKEEADPFQDFQDFKPKQDAPIVDGAKARSTDLSITGQAFDETEVQAKKEAKKLSKETGIPFDEAEALIFEKKPNQIKLEKNQDEISKYFPIASEWAKEMDNYALLRDNTKTITKIETQAKAINKSFVSDMGTAFKSNAYTLEEAYTMIATVLGGMSPKQAEKALREIEASRNEEQLSKYAVPEKRLSASFQRIEKSFGTTGRAISDLLDTTWMDIYKDAGATAQKLKEAFEGGIESADSVLDTLVTIGENPAALAILGARTSGSIATSIGGAAVGGTIGSVAGPKGAAVGAKAGAGTASFLFSFGSYLKEQLEEFRDPMGVLLINEALSDPERVAKWRLKAASYGVTMAVIDAWFTGMAGKSLVKPATGNSFLKKAISKTGDLAVGTAVQAAGEGIGEAGATIAAEASVGELTPEKAGAAVGKGLTEAVASIVPGAGMDIAGAAGRRAFDWARDAKQSIAKTKVEVKKSNEANTAYNTLQEIRKTMEEDSAVGDNPEGMADLINRSVTPTEPETETELSQPADDMDGAIEAEVKNIKEQITNGYVSILPSEWESFVRESGGDPVDAISLLGNEVARDYVNNKESDTSIDISVGDWVIGTKDMPEADAIARVNGNQYNAVEGGRTAEELEKNPFQYFHQSAFHGSPYKFDKFSTEKIGTGEGAQAFGFGLYFTEDKDIAEWYRKKLTRDSGNFTKDGKTLTVYGNEGLSIEALKEYYTPGQIVPGYASSQKVLQFIEGTRGEGDWFVQSISVDAEGNPIPGERPKTHFTTPDFKTFKNVMQSRGWATDKGQTYQVNIPEKEQMLDWDKTVEDQNSYVAGIIESLKEQLSLIETNSGKTLYKALARQLGGDKQASDFLKSKGIAGIKYTAQGGISDKKNFVVFSDQDVSIAQTFYQQDGNEPPVIPGQEGEDFIPPVGDFSGDAVLRPVQLYDKFRNDAERSVFKKILRELRDTTAWAKEVPKESLDVVAELQFRHMRTRADMLGRTIDEISNMSSFGMTTKTGTRGLFRRFGKTFMQPYAVAFNRTADAATIVHELGHSWLHEMSEDWPFISNIPDQQLTAKQREYKEVMDLTAKELGLESMDQLYNRSDKEVTHIHERFSQTTENYFLEGKFKDSRVKKLLDYFRQWMTKIAHIVGKTYPEHPALAITPEVERLFNVLLDANDKVEQELYPMFNEPMFPEGFLGRDQEKYTDLIQDANSEAIADFYGKMIKAPLKEREQMINKALDEFTKEAEEEVNNLPSMRLLRDMETYYAQYKKKELESDPRISFESFKQLLAEGRDTKAIELRAKLSDKMISTRGKGGVDIEIIMQQMGITDPNEMLNLLQQATQKEQLINDRVNALIDKRFPPLKTDKEIHDLAVEAMNRAGKEKTIRKEFDILIDKYRPQMKVLIEKGMLPAGLLGTKDAKKIMEAKADEIVLESGVAGFNIGKLLNDSNSHGTRAAKAFKDGNITHAFEEKYKQSIHFYAYKKAINIVKNLAETKVLANAFQKIATDPKKAMTHDIDVMTYGVQIIQMFSNGMTSLPMLNISAFSDKSGISEDSVELINGMIQDMAIGANGRGGSAVSVRTYLEFGVILKTLLKIAKDAKKVEIGGQTLSREEFKARLIAEVGPRLAKDQGLTITQREALQNILMGLRPVRAELASLFKSDADFERSALGALYNEITTAEAIRNEKLDVQREKIVNAVKEATKADSVLSALVRPITSLVGSTILNKPPKPVRMQNLGITLDNKAELYMFMLYLGSESGAEKLLRGGVKGSGPLAGYDIETNELDMSKVQADIDGLIADGTLTKKDFDMLQVVWDAFDALHPDAKKAVRAVDGRNLGYVKGKTVKTPWGDYRGGYIPITSDTYVKQQSLESMRSPDNAMYKTSDFYSNMDMSWTNNRGKDFYDVNVDFSRITAKLAGTANVAYLKQPLMNIGKVLGSPDVMNAIENRRPGFYDASLIPWFDRTKLQQYSEPSREFHNKFAKMLRSNANLKFYFGNVTSALKQYIGLSNAIPLVGAKNMSIAAGKFVTAPIANKRFISEQDIRMKQMFESHHINQIKSFENLELNFSWATTARDKANQIAFYLLQSCQSHVSAIVWMAGYEKALKEGLTEKQAINFATNAVKNSQGSTTVSDMARVQFGTDAYKLFTMFSMVPITGGSELYKSYMRAGDSKSDSAKAGLKLAAVISAGAFTVAIPTIIEAMIAESLKGDDDEEEDIRKLAKKEKITIEQARQLRSKRNSEMIIKDMAFNFSDQAIPIYGRWVAKPLIYGQMSVSPLLDNIAQDFTAAKSGARASEAGAEITAREFAGLMNMLTYTSGLPFTFFGLTAKMDEKSMDKKEATRKAKQRTIALKKAKKKRNE